jgi:flagellar basal-body rod modification protein FlgD
MDPVSLLGSGADTQSASKAPNAFSDLTSEEFVKIMFTELSNQDPLKPNDSAALLEQMANLRSIQSDLELGGRLEALTTRGELAAAGGLIGKRVSGLTESGERVAGTVRSVSRTSEGPVLNLASGARVSFSQVDEMADAEPSDAGDETGGE